MGLMWTKELNQQGRDAVGPNSEFEGSMLSVVVLLPKALGCSLVVLLVACVVLVARSIYSHLRLVHQLHPFLDKRLSTVCKCYISISSVLSHIRIPKVSRYLRLHVVEVLVSLSFTIVTVVRIT